MSEIPEVNPEQIAYLSYQIRQCEIVRNVEKVTEKKQAMTMRIHTLKQELDPLLQMYADQQRKKQNELKVVGKDLGNRDVGHPDVIKELHLYAKMKLTQGEVVDSLPVSVAGEFNGAVYIIHFEKNK